MKNLLACLTACATLAYTSSAVEIMINESCETRLDFTLSSLDEPLGPGMRLIAGHSSGSVAVLPGGGVIVSWSGTPQLDQFFVVEAQPGVFGVIDFSGSQVLEVFGGLRFVYGEPIGERDADGDGVSDEVDAWPNSITTATVWVGDCDTGVSNPTDEAGYTLADRVTEALAAAAANAKNHGKFVSAMARSLKQLVAAGTIGSAEHAAIMACVGPADEGQFR